MRSPTDRGANRDAASNVRAGSSPIVPPSLCAETFSRPSLVRCRPVPGRADPELCRPSLAVAPGRLVYQVMGSSGGVDLDVLKVPGDGQRGGDAAIVTKRSPDPDRCARSRVCLLYTSD